MDDRGEKVVVGVNKYVMTETRPIAYLRIDEAVELEQIDRVRRFKASRDMAKVEGRLKQLADACREPRNVMPILIEAVKDYASLGEISEVYRQGFGLFRPQKHLERLNHPARRLCIPPLDPEQALRALVELVGLERDWVPSTLGTSLYVRPTIIANEAFLGVRPAKSYIYYVILSPVGAYYPEGMNPVRILVVDKYVRAVEGGVGGAKTGVNYAASLYAAEEAKHAGFTQVLWLDGRERKYIDEVGTMNIMLKIGDEVVTPPLSGTILAGVTRDSALTLMRDWGLRVAERPVTIDEVAAAARKGTLEEGWGPGTAAVISPVGELAYKGEQLVINGGRIGTLTQKLYDAIAGIQYGTAPDTRGWTVPV